MTDAELLQHCKDEVARETAALLKKDWKNWADLSYDMWSVPAHLLALSDRAAKLAIQKAREEGIKGGEATGYDAGYSKGYEHGYESGQADLKSGFDRKLTAPGR